MAEALIGYEGVLKYKVGGQGAGGSYTTLNNCTSPKLQASADTADSSTRGSGGFKTTEPTLIDLGLTFDMVIDSADVDYAAFRTAFFARSMIAIEYYDETGGDGVRADYKITSFEQSQDLADVQKVAVEMKPCRSDTAPNLIT